MTETTGYLGTHTKSHLQCWGNQLWLRPRVTDHFQRQEIFFFQTVLPCLDKVWQSFFLYPSCPVQTMCILSVVETWAVPCPKASFAKKKTSSKWSVFGSQYFLGNRSVLSKEIMSHVNRVLSYLNTTFHSSLKCLQSLCI